MHQETSLSRALPRRRPRLRLHRHRKSRVALLGTLVLFPAGQFTQGSERREQGRRSNETLRQVTLSRPFYMAETEVTNAQFNAFRTGHVSGIAWNQHA